MKTRYYQDEAEQSLYEYFRTHPEPDCNPVVAMPTGTGKSIVIARFIKGVLSTWPGQRIMMLTHVKELISQNADKMQTFWPQAPLGIYSAGLGQKNSNMPITFAGIQSAQRHPELFGWQDLVIIDECHLVSPSENTGYQQFIKALRKINPRLRVIGLSATPYRLGLGMITDGGIFTDVCYDITGLHAFNKLIDEGYLCPLIPMPTETQLDISGVHMRGGEFVPAELQEAVAKYDITRRALLETREVAHSRNHWLIFASGIDHVRMTVDVLRELGIAAAGVHSKMDPVIDGDRDINLARFMRGEIRALVNADILTTGFDFPALDCIILLRPTSSPGLHVQILGRGTRPLYSPGYDLEDTTQRLESMAASPKQNCIAEGELVLTDSGLVPIEKVTLEMRVWDGVQFVEHCGTVFRGKQKVIRYAGLTATPDHKVWTEEGWRTFGECAEQQTSIAITGIGRKAIPLAASNYRSGFAKRLGKQSPLGSKVHKLRGNINKGLLFADKLKSQLSSLQQSSKRPKMVGQQSNFGEAALHKSERYRVESLRRTGNRISFFICHSDGNLGTGKFRSSSRIRIRSNKKQWPLRTWKSSVCNSLSEPIQYAISALEHSNAQVQVTIPRSQVRGRDSSNFALERSNFRSNSRSIFQLEIEQTERGVWDILNAGPNHRFTVNGLLVSNCLVLDFAGNTMRLGPINDPRIPKKKGPGTGEIPIKQCNECGCLNHISARVCLNCGEEFTFKEKITEKASTLALIVRDEPQVEIFNVDSVTYAVHNKIGYPPSLKVSYFCGIRRFTEWVTLEHHGNSILARARKWWKDRTDIEIPDTIAEALPNVEKLKVPTKIRVWVNRKYPEILAHLFEEEEPSK